MHRIWFFLALIFGLSWLFWMPAALSARDATTFPVSLLYYLGGAGPPLAAIILTHLERDREGWRNYWQQAELYQGLLWISQR